MVITSKLTVDLAERAGLDIVGAVQDDRYSRNLEFTLLQNGEAFAPPADATVLVSFKKKDRSGGSYDTLPDGTAAGSISGNVVTVALAPQVLTFPGPVDLVVGLVRGKEKLHTFVVYLDVQPNPGLQVTSENYFKVSGALADSGWAGNMYLGTDENGKVVVKDDTATGIELVDLRTGYDGTVYKTAGEAVRGQCASLDSKIQEVAGTGKNKIDISKVIAAGTGRLQDTTGVLVDGSNWIYGDYRLNTGETYTLSKTSGALSLFFYNADGSYAGISNRMLVDSALTAFTFVAPAPILRISSFVDMSTKNLQIEVGDTATEYEHFRFELKENVKVTDPGVFAAINAIKEDVAEVKTAVGDLEKQIITAVDPTIKPNGYYSASVKWQPSNAWTTAEYNISGMDGVTIEVDTYNTTASPVLVLDAKSNVLASYPASNNNATQKKQYTITIPDGAVYLEVPCYDTSKYSYAVSGFTLATSVKAAHNRIDGFDSAVRDLEEDVGGIESVVQRTYNLNNSLTCESGYLNINGNKFDSDSFFTTDFISVSSADLYVKTNVTFYTLAFYDADKKFVSAVQNVASAEIPSTVAFVRASFLAFLSNASLYMVYVGAEEKDYIPYRVVPRKYIEEENGGNTNFPSVSYVLTKDLYIANGVQVDINYQSITKGIDIDKMAERPVIIRGIYPTYGKHAVLVGGQKADQTIEISCQPEWGRYLSKSIKIHNVPANAGSGQTKKVLFIGDSKTDANVYTQCLLDMFANDPMSIQLLGTRGNTDTNRHEGRSGWSAKNYVLNDAYRGVIEDSPFYNPNTQTFDFSYYMAQNGYSGVDYVFINLGTNDADDYANFISYYRTMIDSIRAYNSSIIIGVWVPAPFATFGGYTHRTNDSQTFQMMEAIIDAFDNEESKANKIFVIPTHMNINTEYDYPWKDVPYTTEKPECTYRVCTDQIHEANGYYKDANVIFGYIKHFATL